MVREGFSLFNEGWKSRDDALLSGHGDGVSDSDKVTDDIFRNHGWNEVESGFRFFLR